MNVSRRARAGLALVAAAATAVPVVALGGPASATAHDRTSAKEAARVDRVDVSLRWFDCADLYGTPGAQCATPRLPLDYDKPDGATTTVAVLRIRAARPKERIGTLFINPGGPGGSGTGMAAYAPYFLGQDVLDRFDVVGFDPRGTNAGENVECWPSALQQAHDLTGLAVPFPVGAKENAAAIASARAYGRACSGTGRPLSASMSTAEVARDMDVLRRAVGDKALTYLGFSYGTYLGQVYANMFPDRVRALVVDGVLDPVAWAGTARTAGVPQTARLRSGQGADTALHEILARCGKAGKAYCALAGVGDPTELFDELVARARKGPITIVDPSDPANPIVFTYAQIYGLLLGALYDQFYGYQVVDSFLTAAVTGTLPAATDAQRAAAVRTIRAVRARLAAKGLVTAEQGLGTGATTAPAGSAGSTTARPGFSYDNSPESFAAVRCTDGLNPRDAADWPAYAAADAKKAPGFGPLWTWSSVQCAARTWTARDEDAYRGPFTRRTANPVLVVGDYYDPATNYLGAVAASQLLPNSRLLTSDSFGHTAYGTSDCVTQGIENYLVTTRLPARGTLCVGPQPFTTPLEPAALAKVHGAAPQAVPPPARTAPATRSGARPAPVAPFVPGVL